MPPLNKPNTTGALNTLRNWLGEDQWREALSIAKSQRRDVPPDQDQRAEGEPRHEAVQRCLLRVDRGGSAPGIYIVHSRDISAGGICLIHGGSVKPKTICAVIIESTAGRSLLAGGVVAWCKPIKNTEPPAYEIGVRFYQPIDTRAFADQADAA